MFVKIIGIYLTRMKLEYIKSAIFDDDETYRYILRRIWKSDLGTVCWVMLNPSTADAVFDDPTIRRCMGFASRWHYGGIVVVNLFAYRSSDPGLLDIITHDVVGPDNDRWISNASHEADLTVCGWGAALRGKFVKKRIVEVLKVLKKPHYLSLTKTGFPSHPLYQPSYLEPRPLNRSMIKKMVKN